MNDLLFFLNNIICKYFYSTKNKFVQNRFINYTNQVRIGNIFFYIKLEKLVFISFIIYIL